MNKVFLLGLVMLCLMPLASALEDSYLYAYWNFSESASPFVDVIAGTQLTCTDCPEFQQSDSGFSTDGYETKFIIGNSDEVDGTLEFANGSSFSVNIWINNTIDHSNYHYFLEAGAECMTFSSSMDSPYKFGVNYLDSDSAHAILTYDFGDDTLRHMVTLTYDDGDKNATMYWDGVPVDSAIIGTDGRDCGSDMGLGYRRSSGDKNADGRVNDLSIWKIILNGTQVSDLYNSGVGEFFPFDAPPPPPTFDITAIDYYDSTAINNFTAYVSNATASFVESTTNGTLRFSFTTGIYNITIDADNYFNVSFEGYDVSSDLEAVPYQAVLDVYATELISNYSLINFTIEAAAQTNSTTDAYVRFFLRAGSYSLNFSKIGYYNKTGSFTIGTEETNATTIIGLFNSYLNVSANTTGGVAITTFLVNVMALNYSYSIEASTTNGSVMLPLINGSYNILIDAVGYELKNETISLSSGLTNHNFNLYTTNSIWFYFRDTETKSFVGNVTFDLISTFAAYNYSTPNGSIYVDLIVPENYTIRYRAAGYRESFYYFNLINRTFNNLTIYLVQNSSSTIVTATVYNEISDLVEGAIIKALRYDIETNSYILQEAATTNFEGETKLNLILNFEYYKFIIEYQGDVKKITEPTYIYSDTLAFQILIGADVGQLYEESNDIARSLIFNEATGNFRLTYSDTNGAVDSVCLFVYRMTAGTKLLVNSSCLSSASGVILIAPTNITGATYLAKAYAYMPNEYPLTSLYYTFRGGDIIGKIGLFAVVLLTIVFFTVGLWRPILIPILTPMPVLVGSLAGLINIPVSIALPIQIAGLIIAWIISDRG